MDGGLDAHPGAEAAIADPRYLTAAGIQLLPYVQAWIGWAGAFAVLAIGPALGVAAMLRLRGRPEAIRLAGGRR